MKRRKTVIITGYKCNNRCIFCFNYFKRNLRNKSTNEIIAEMTEARKKGITYLEIIGGEQTIRTDIIEIIKIARELGFRTISMATNGRMFYFRDFCKNIIKAGLNHIVFSIHGHNERLHDYLTQAKGSFKQLLEGIRNVKEIGIKKMGTNTTIVKQNYRFLPQIGKLIYSLGIRNAEFIFVDPSSGAAHNNFYKLVPRISQAAGYMRRCLDIGKGSIETNNRSNHWHVRYVPLCYFQGYREQVSELNEIRYFKTEHLGPDFKNLDVEMNRAKISRMKPQKCMDCIYFRSCEGIWKDYIKRYGDKELKPVRLK